MRVTAWMAAAAASAGALAIAFACKTSTDTSCGSGSPPSLSGTYSFSSYTLGTTTWTAPPSTGQLQMTGTAYQYSVTLDTGTPPTHQVTGAGTYAITGAACITLTSSVDTTHFSGTFTLSTANGITTFRETGSDGTHVVHWVWVK